MPLIRSFILVIAEDSALLPCSLMTVSWGHDRSSATIHC